MFVVTNLKKLCRVRTEPHCISYWRQQGITWCLNHMQPRTPYDFYHPYDFLPVRPSEAVLFSLPHQATGPLRLDMAVHLWFGWIIRRTPRVPHVVPFRASYGPRTGIFNIFHILRDPYGARAWPARVPYGALADTQGNWHNQNWHKSHTGVVFGRSGPGRAP